MFRRVLFRSFDVLGSHPADRSESRLDADRWWQQSARQELCDAGRRYRILPRRLRRHAGGRSQTLRSVRAELLKHVDEYTRDPAMKTESSTSLKTLRQRVLRFVEDEVYPAEAADRKSTRLNSSHYCASRMPSSA